MVLHGTMVRNYAELLMPGKTTDAELERLEDSRSLLEPPLEYDPDTTADVIIRNARLGHGEGACLRDVAIAGQCIVRVEECGGVDGNVRPDTYEIDAAGRSVLPGFVDSHMHLAVAMQRLRACDVEDVQGAEEFVSRVREHARKYPDEPVLNVFGLHYFDDPVIPSDTCRTVLDGLVSDRPLVVYAHDLHTAWANTPALEQAGLFHTMPPFPHLIEELGLQEKIVLDPQGKPTGEFREPEVYYFLAGPLQAKYAPTVDRQLQDLRAVCRSLTKLGITGVHRMGLAQPSEDIAFLMLLLELDQRGELPIRVNASISAVADEHMLQDVLKAYGARTLLNQGRSKELSAAEVHDGLLQLLQESGEVRRNHVEAVARSEEGAAHPHMDSIQDASGHIHRTTHHVYVKHHASRDNPHRGEDMDEDLKRHPRVRCDTIKIFMDGVVEKDTAYRLDKTPTAGIPEFGQEHLNRLLAMADRLGLQVAAHCIGDASVRSMLDAISGAHGQNDAVDRDRGHRIPHRIEHIEMCRREDLPRFGREDVVASMQPLHERPPMTMWHELVPQKRWDTAFAWREALEDGATLVFGSDWPIVSCDVRKGVNHAVTRAPWKQGEREQGLNLEQALDAYTTGAAHTEYSSAIKGHIRPGMLADMVILSGNVEELAQESFDLGIDMTICDGEVVYDRFRE